MKNCRPAVFRFVLQAHAVAVSGMSAAETGNYFRALLRDLESGKGTTPQSTEMIEHAKMVSQAKRIGGLALAMARLGISDDPNNLSPAAPSSPSTPSVKNDHIPTLEQWMAHAAVIGCPDNEAQESFKYWCGAQWKEDNGKDVLNWRKKVAGTKARFIEKKAKESSRQNAPSPRQPASATFADNDPLFGKDALAKHPKEPKP